jgi:DNA-directed RNA polymerase subunit RPC12/RpoP
MTKEMSIQCPNCGSKIVYETMLNRTEKILTHIFPVTPYRCQPCNYRFVYYSSPKPKTKKRLLITFVSVLAAMITIIISTLLFQLDANHFSSENNPEPLPVIIKTKNSLQEKNNLLSDQITTSNHTGNKAQDKSKNDNSKVADPHENLIYAEVILREKPMFGVNWEQHALGLKIIKISSGPLQHAGIKIGDIIHTINDSVITHEEQLLLIRDQIFSNQMASAILCIIQSNEKKYFKLRHEVQSGQS